MTIKTRTNQCNQSLPIMRLTLAFVTAAMWNAPPCLGQNNGADWKPVIRVDKPKASEAPTPVIINAPEKRRAENGGASESLTAPALRVAENGTGGQANPDSAKADNKESPKTISEGEQSGSTSSEQRGSTSAQVAPAQEKQNQTQEVEKSRPGPGLAQTYCDVVVDAALAAKLAQEKQEAEALKKELEAKISQLQASIDDQRRWLQRREEFQQKATDNLVSVYTTMDAEAAAQRLTAVSDEIAAAILVKLPTRSASAILGEMPSETAGRLTAYIAGAAELRPKSSETRATQ